MTDCRQCSQFSYLMSVLVLLPGSFQKDMQSYACPAPPPPVFYESVAGQGQSSVSDVNKYYQVRCWLPVD